MRKLYAIAAIFLGAAGCNSALPLSVDSLVSPASSPAPSPSPSLTYSASPYDYPEGIFASSGANTASANPLNDVNVEGGLVRVNWSQIETSPGTFNWSALDLQVDAIECNAICYSGTNPNGSCKNSLAGNGRTAPCTPKSWSLSVLGGPVSPTWLYTGIGNLGVATFSITVNSMSYTIPKFWDQTLQLRLSSLATALAARYGTDPALRLVYIPQMSRNGVEGQFVGVTDQALINAGFTVDNWVAAVESALHAFASGFSTKPVAVELHYILSSSCAAMRIMNDIAARPSLMSQMGVAIWWLDGATNYQKDLLTGLSALDPQDEFGVPETGDPSDLYGRACTNEAVFNGGFQGFTAAGGHVYSQVVQQSSVTASFPNGYPAVFTQAESLGIHYVEAWQQDIGTSWETDFENFNAAQ